MIGGAPVTIVTSGGAPVTITNGADLADANITPATPTAPAIIRGTADLSTYPGVTVGVLPGTAERTANGTAIQAALDWAGTNRKYIEAPQGIYDYIATGTENARNVGLQIKPGTAGFIGAGADTQGGTRFVNRATNHPALTIGSVSNTASDLIQSFTFGDFACGHGVSQAGQTSADGLLLGRICFSKMRGNVQVSPQLISGSTFHAYCGLRIGISINQFFFQNVLDNMLVKSGQAHLMRSDANGTGNKWGAIYCGGISDAGGAGTFGARLSLSAEPVFINSPEFGAVGQFNVEWANSSTQTAALRVDNCNGLVIEHAHFEGNQINNFDPRLVIATASRLNINSMVALDNWIASANATGVPCIFRVYGDSALDVGQLALRWNGSGYNAEAVASMAFSLYREDTSLVGRRPNVEVRNSFISGNTGAFSLDTRLTGTAPGSAGALYGWRKYTYDKTLSATEGAVIEARNADITIYAAHRSPQIRLKQALTADRKVIMSASGAASGIGNVAIRNAGDTVNLVREGGATGAFNWLGRDSADAVTFATLGTAGAEAHAIVDTAGAWDAS